MEARKQREDEIDAVIVAWSAKQDPHRAAAMLQGAGVAGAPALHTEEIIENPHFIAANFFIDLVRVHSGPQRQAGIAIRQNGKRLGSHTPAPLLGEHSWEVFARSVGLSRTAYDKFVMDGIISFAPGSLRSAMPQSGEDRFPQQAKG